MIILILSQSCAKPEQPDLTNKEIAYFSELDKKYRCKATRSIEPRLLDNYKTKDAGRYQLRMTYSSCENISLDNLDSLGAYIAANLYTDVLDKSKKFNDIVILFDCIFSENNFKSKYYHYPVDSLISNK